MKRLLIIMIIAVCCAANSVAQTVSVKSDAAWDAIMAPSLGTEIVMTKKSSLNIDAMFGWNVFGMKMRVAAFQPEWRIYLHNRPMYHHYIGFTALLASYKLHARGTMYDGDCAGGGLTFGYVLPLGKHFTVDFHTSLGYMFYTQKEYPMSDNYDAHYLNDDGFPTTNSHGSMLVPLKIGVAFAYIIK